MGRNSGVLVCFSKREGHRKRGMGEGEGGGVKEKGGGVRVSDVCNNRGEIVSEKNVVAPVSNPHLTLPTNREV